MGLLVALLIAVVIWLWLSVSRLSERVEQLDRKLLDALDAIRALHRQTHDKHGASVKAPSEAPAPVPLVRVDPALPPAPPVVTPRTPPPVQSPPVQTAPVQTPPTPAPAAPVNPPRRAEPSLAQPAVVAASRESWELTVGTSWMNKIGVLVFVIGVALLVGYSFAHIGAAGRVAIGYVLSGALLGTGVWLERRPAFRNYAYGLVAGGWAGLYFTTFAMHELPEARLVESELTAVTLLTAVAGGMIGHSLRYRSPVVTSLTFVVAYVTLALSPLSGFSLAASVPLAMTVLVVSQRLGWPSISTLGIVATYGAFILRGEVFPGGAMDPASAIPYVTLAAYWLTFEIADLIGLRMRQRADAPRGTAGVSMLALNAAGVLGAMVVVAPTDQPATMSTLLFATGAAYIGTAIVRAWLLPERRDHADTDRPFDVSHAATAIAAALFVVAVGLRFSGTRTGLGWLLETQLLFVAGLTLRDRWLRRMASTVAALVSVQTLMLCLSSVRDGLLAFNLTTGAAVAVAVALIWYANRETLRMRGNGPQWLEGLYPWAATLLLSSAGWVVLMPAYQGLFGILIAAILLEAGIRRDPHYAWQAYLLGAVAGYATVAAFLAPADAAGFVGRWGRAPSPTDEWLALPAAIAVLAAASVRLMTPRALTGAPDAKTAAGAAAALATVLMMVFEWRVLAPQAVAPAWAVTALGLVVAGASGGKGALRWLAYVVVSAAAVRQITPLVERAPGSAAETAAAGVVVLAMYLVAYLGGRRSSPADADRGVTPERAATASLSLAATAAFVLFKYRVLPADLVAPAWAATALVLVVLGQSRQRDGQLWQGFILAAGAAVQAAAALLEVQTAEGALGWSAGSVAALVYATAWLTRRSVPHGGAVAATRGLFAAATGLAVLLQSRVFGDLTLGPTWAIFGVALLSAGFWRRVDDLRGHGYLVLALGTLRAGKPVFGASVTTGAAIAWLAACLAIVFVAALASRRLARALGSTPASAEHVAITSLLAGASVMLAALILSEVQPSMVTLTLGLQGLGLMLAGLTMSERVLRLSGLALLLGCLLKLFVYDLRELEPLPRIFSFVVLGLVLLGISWIYTRYRERIMKLL